MYQTLVGLKSDLSKPASVPKILSNKSQDVNKIDERKSDKLEGAVTEDDSDESSYDGTDDGTDEDSDSEKESKFVNSARPKHETTEERKVFFKSLIVTL